MWNVCVSFFELLPFQLHCCWSHGCDGVITIAIHIDKNVFLSLSLSLLLLSVKQIESFMSEIGTSMKVVVIKAIRQLCLRYPRKSGLLLQFMHNCLRDEGEFAYKQALVNTILDLMDKLEGMKTAGLNALGEFIEDCEFPQLSKQVLHVLGTEAPSTGTPGRYIRYIFNRVILEVPSVRAAAVSALAKLAARVASVSFFSVSFHILFSHC